MSALQLNYFYLWKAREREGKRPQTETLNHLSGWIICINKNFQICTFKNTHVYNFSLGKKLSEKVLEGKVLGWYFRTAGKAKSFTHNFFVELLLLLDFCYDFITVV